MSWMLVRAAAVTAPAATDTGDDGHLVLEMGGLGMIIGVVVWFTSLAPVQRGSESPKD